MAKTKTKAIVDSVNNTGGGGNVNTKDLSTVARTQMIKALTPKQCFEVSIHARKAVTGIADQIAKATLRLFSRRTGDEILSGDLYNLLRRPNKYSTKHTFIRDLVTWLNITGEFAVWMVSQFDGGKPDSLHILDPDRLRELPYNSRSLDVVTGWQYNSPFEFNNAQGQPLVGQFEIPVDQVMFAKNFNPNNQVRGLSPMISGAMEISTNYFANRFNAQWFQNGTVGDIIVRFPKGTDEQHAREWVNQWSLQHQIFQNNGFKVTALVGDEIQVESLAAANNNKAGQFVDLKAQNAEDIGGLFGVPPSVMGFLSKTRFDTIDMELESFAENTLMPQMNLLSEVLQTQLADRYFKNSTNTRKEKTKVGPLLRKAIEKAVDEGESDTIVLLDPDSLPIVSKMNLNKFNLIDKIRSAADLSANEAAEYVGIELPPRPERDAIWVPSNRQNITKQPEIVPVEPKVEPIVPEDDGQNEEQDEEKLLKQARILKQTRQGYRNLRAIVFEAFAKNRMYSRAQAMDLINPEQHEGLAIQVHKDYLALRSILKAGGTAEELINNAKKYLNSIKPAYLKEIIDGN